MSGNVWLILLIVSAGIQTGILLLLTLAEWLAPVIKPAAGTKSFSIIVAAKNEADNLRELLPLLLNQHYSGPYEVILSLDHCTDSSEKIVQSFCDKFQQLKFINISITPENFSPKKFAISKAIESARYPNLAFTDADCRPDLQWLEKVNQSFGEKTELVIGVSPYQKRPGLLNLFIRLETLMTAFLYTNAARIGFPWMAVGRNLAYKKSFFATSGGFAEHSEKLSGDDDLIVNRHAKGQKTSVMARYESFVFSLPPVRFSSWIKQKMRHISASKGYSAKSKTLLTIYQGSHALFYLSLAIGIIMIQNPSAVLTVLAARTIWHLALLGPSMIRWRDPILLLTYPLLDPLFFLYNLFLVPASLIAQPQWKKK